MYQGLGYDIGEVMKTVKAEGLMISLCTIQQPDTTLGSSGAKSGNFINVTGLINIPCQDAVDGASVQATEARSLSEVLMKGLRHVALNGYYPTLVTGWRKGWIALVDTVAYNILGVEPDSQRTQTRLRLELATV